MDKNPKPIYSSTDNFYLTSMCGNKLSLQLQPSLPKNRESPPQ